MAAIRVEDATAGGPGTLLGRASATRAEWEAARLADAADLNRLISEGGEVAAYVVPLWSNGDAERCLRELRGFDEARVYVEPPDDDGAEATLALLAETEMGAASQSADPPALAAFLHACAGLEIPIHLDHPLALKALALALGEDLTPREIEAVLRGAWEAEPDADALEHARDLLAS